MRKSYRPNLGKNIKNSKLNAVFLLFEIFYQRRYLVNLINNNSWRIRSANVNSFGIQKTDLIKSAQCSLYLAISQEKSNRNYRKEPVRIISY